MPRTPGRSSTVVGSVLLTAALACGDGATAPPASTAAAGGDDVLRALDAVGAGSRLAAPLAVPLAPLATGGCSYADGRYSCPPVTRDGVTLTRVFGFRDGGGAPQRQYDALTTAFVFNRITLRGRVVRPGSTVELDHQLTQQASGLAGRETRRVVDGTGAGTTRVAATEQGTERTFTIAHADTTRGLVLAVAPTDRAAAGAATYPLGGSVTSVLRLDGGELAGGAFDVRATVRYDGTSVARVELGTRGVTQLCTLDLAARPPRLACPGGVGIPIF